MTGTDLESSGDLKSLVTETLRKKGVLGKFKAQLRTTILSVLDENEHIYMENVKAAEVISTDQGKLLADLVREYNSFYNLEYTNSVFVPEANLPETSRSRAELTQELDLKSPSKNQPLLMVLLSAFLSGSVGPRLNSDSRDGDEADSPGSSPPAVPAKPNPMVKKHDEVEEVEQEYDDEGFEPDSDPDRSKTPPPVEPKAPSRTAPAPLDRKTVVPAPESPAIESPSETPPAKPRGSEKNNDGEDAGDDRSFDNVSYSDVTATQSDVGELNEKYSYVEEANNHSSLNEAEEEDYDFDVSVPERRAYDSRPPEPAEDSDSDRF